MKSKLVVSLFSFLALLAGVAQAQDHSKVDIFAGYSYDRWDGAKKFNLNGGSASVAYNANNWLSGVADFGGYHNGNVLNSGLDFTLSTYLWSADFLPPLEPRHALWRSALRRRTREHKYCHGKQIGQWLCHDGRWRV